MDTNLFNETQLKVINYEYTSCMFLSRPYGRCDETKIGYLNHKQYDISHLTIGGLCGFVFFFLQYFTSIGDKHV
jgi:hypothetical protein